MKKFFSQLVLPAALTGLVFAATSGVCSQAHPNKPRAFYVNAPADTGLLPGAGAQAGYESLPTDAADPLASAFAHNDYLHPHPLLDALQNGFTNIEADIFLTGGHLVVAHVCPYFKRTRTLESLYLQPLYNLVVQNNGRVYKGYDQPVILMIDIKTNAQNTYQALKPLLEKYSKMLSEYNNGKITYRAVTVVLSGHKPYQLAGNENRRLAFIDEDLFRTPLDTVNNRLFAMASCRYSRLLTWKGDGPMPVFEKETLCAFTRIAHKMGARVRLWASPEKKEVWNELLACGVDLINTDQLVALKDFLAAYNQLNLVDRKTLQ
jgi:hypothetical protein